jgi:hypothetical protein
LKQPGHVRYVVSLGPSITTPRPDGLQQVRYIGTGLMMIRRTVFERFIESLGSKIAYVTHGAPPDNQRYDFFPQGLYRQPDDQTYLLHEDWGFCRRCHELGIRIFADTRLAIAHRGRANFPLIETA